MKPSHKGETLLPLRVNRGPLGQSLRVRSPNRDVCDPGGGLVGLIYISQRSGVHPATHLSNHGIGLQGFGVSSWSSHGGGLHHGLGRTKVGAWMPRTVGVVLAH